MRIPMQITGEKSLPMSVTASEEIRCTLGAAFQMASVPEYEGAYEFTPSDSEQTIATEGELLTQDIVVHAIPNNYGLVTWDGVVLTVS